MTLPDSHTLSPPPTTGPVEVPRPRGPVPPLARRHHRRWVLAAVGLAVVLAAAVAVVLPGQGDRPTVGPAVRMPAGAGEPVLAGRSHPIGEAAAWRDGVTAVVRSVRRTTFDALATTAGPGLRVAVSVRNGSRSALDLSPTAEVRLAGRPAEPVYATGCDGLSDLAGLPPGATATGTLCYAGTAPTLTVAFTPTYAHHPITWTTTPRVSS